MTQIILGVIQVLLSVIILINLIQLRKHMANTLDDVLTGVQNESTVDDSIITLINNLAAQIKAGGLSAADQAKVDSIVGVVTANIAKVSAAVTANTPAAPPPVTPPPTPTPTP